MFAVHLAGRRVSKPYPHRLQAIIDAIERGWAWRDRVGVYLHEDVTIEECRE